MPNYASVNKNNEYISTLVKSFGFIYPNRLLKKLHNPFKASLRPILVRKVKIELNLPLQNKQVSIKIIDSTYHSAISYPKSKYSIF